jgi:hypothetical protein
MKNEIAIAQCVRATAKQEKGYPPNFAETTEIRRKNFSANLGVFGVSRRKSFCFFCRDFTCTDYKIVDDGFEFKAFDFELRTSTQGLITNTGAPTVGAATAIELHGRCNRNPAVSSCSA